MGTQNNKHGVSWITELKNQCYKQMVKTYLCGLIANRKHIFICDGTAGSGNNPITGDKGSPRILLDAIYRLPTIMPNGDERMTCRAVVCEQIKKTFKALSSSLCKLEDHQPQYEMKVGAWSCGMYNANHTAALKVEIAKLDSFPKYYGYIYIDTNGVPIDTSDLGIIIKNSVAMQKVDYIQRVSATALKRTNKRFGNGILVKDIVSAIPKKKWFIQKPIPNDPQQWTFLIGTNWTGYPSAFKEMGIYEITSAQGQSVITDVTYTKKEQATWFDV